MTNIDYITQNYKTSTIDRLMDEYNITKDEIEYLLQLDEYRKIENKVNEHKEQEKLFEWIEKKNYYIKFKKFHDLINA